MSAAAAPTLIPWPVVPNTLSAAQLLARLDGLNTVDPVTEERVHVYALRHRRGHVTEVHTADRDEDRRTARAAGGRYTRTIIRRKQQGGCK